jgi:cytochrome P450
LLFVSGHETDVALITNGMLALLRKHDQLALLRSDPGLVAGAVEETTTPHDTSVIVLLAAPNRDPAQFADLDTFEITRSPNRHLGFGGGVHAFFGGPLAKMQGEIALATLVRPLVDPSLVTDKPPYHDNAVHALKAPPISFRSVWSA